MKLIFFLFLLCAIPCEAHKSLGKFKEYFFEVYEPQDAIALEILDEARQMYLNTYDDPSLHDGLTLHDMKIDESSFSSYEEFIEDMFRRDFTSYQHNPSRSLFLVHHSPSNAIVGLCAVLQEAPGHYYIDPIGVDKRFRRQKLATLLLAEVVQELNNFEEITLDTRVFNKPAQKFYDQMGFTRCAAHPNPLKATVYIYYQLTPSTVVFPLADLL